MLRCNIHIRIMMMRCIRNIFPWELARYEAHLLRLDPVDRRLRFGFPIGDDAIRSHVRGLDLDRDRILVTVDDDFRVVGAAHVAMPSRNGSSGRTDAELAFTVDREWRGQGLGTELLRRGVLCARNRGSRRVHLHCLGENTASKVLARRAGMAVHNDSGESEASIELLPATPFTLLGEAIGERWAMWDYSVKQSRPRTLGALLPSPSGAAA